LSIYTIFIIFMIIIDAARALCYNLWQSGKVAEGQSNDQLCNSAALQLCNKNH
jgi:hypothetical protein